MEEGFLPLEGVVVDLVVLLRWRSIVDGGPVLGWWMFEYAWEKQLFIAEGQREKEREGGENHFRHLSLVKNTSPCNHALVVMERES